MKRYSAKLLFQFRVLVNGDSDKRRFCEERIILINAPSAKRALAIAKQKGRSAQFHYENSKGHIVNFEFIGVMGLLHLFIGCENDEVWYDIHERLLPMERSREIIPSEVDLLASLDDKTELTNPRAIAKAEKYRPFSL